MSSRSYQVVYDICTAPFLECCPVWINGFFPITQCRRGYYQYGCFYMVKQFVEEERRYLPPQPSNNKYPTPPISRFRTFIQHAPQNRVSVVEQVIVHQIENQNRAEAERQGISVPKRTYELPKGSENQIPARGRPQYIPPSVPQDLPEQYPEPQQPVQPPTTVFTTYTIPSQVPSYQPPPIGFPNFFGYPSIQTYDQTYRNWFQQVYCDQVERSNQARVQLGLPLLVADSCQNYVNTIPGSSARSRFGNVGLAQDQRIYFPSD